MPLEDRELDDVDHPAKQNPRMESLFGQRLRNAGFLPGPAYTTSRDGRYYNFDRDGSDDIQIVVLGPMTATPFELAAMVGIPYRVIALGALNGEPGNVPATKAALERGYWTVHLRTDEEIEARNRAHAAAQTTGEA